VDSSPEWSSEETYEWTPTQVDRLRARLTHYRLQNKHSWERIATDILYEENLPLFFVDNEETRPLSESLRRLVSGSQVPSKDRLNAIAMHLVSAEYLARSELLENDSGMAAALAFNHFAYGDGAQSPGTDDPIFSLTGVFEHSSRPKGGNAEIRQTLTSEISGRIISVSFDVAEYSNPNFQFDFDANPKMKKRALKGRNEFNGWVAITHSGQAIIFLRRTNYVDSQRTLHVLGVETKMMFVGSLLVLECLSFRPPEDNSPGIFSLPPTSISSVGDATGEKIKDRILVFKNTKSRGGNIKPDVKGWDSNVELTS